MAYMQSLTYLYTSIEVSKIRKAILHLHSCQSMLLQLDDHYFFNKAITKLFCILTVLST